MHFIHSWHQSVRSKSIHYKFFSLLANPKGFGALAPSMRECAQKLQHEKRTCIVGQVLTLRNQYITRKSFTERKSIMKKDVITVFTAKKARQLLKEGFTIVDIKPDRLDPDHKRTLFLFKNEDGLIKKIIE